MARLADRVRQGYNALSWDYRGDNESPELYAAWLEDLCARVPSGTSVLDLGCGCGVPVSRDLVARSYTVIGVDISDVQIERARQLVPGATFTRADATELAFRPGSFGAIVCLYALIHMPLDAQPRLIADCADWLRPGGWMLATVGQREWTGSEDRWLGGDATMWWSHADADTYRQWLTDAGFEIAQQEFIPEGDGGHALFWARKPAVAS